MKITRRKLKELLSEALSEASFEEFGDEEEYDVEELASYHALNGDVDATLYRDNPDYRNAFIDMIIMKFGEERMQQFQDEEEDKESRRLLMDPQYDEDTEDDDLDDMGQVPYSEEYAKMIDTFSPYPKE